MAATTRRLAPVCVLATLLATGCGLHPFTRSDAGKKIESLPATPANPVVADKSKPTIPDDTSGAMPPADDSRPLPGGQVRGAVAARPPQFDPAVVPASGVPALPQTLPAPQPTPAAAPVPTVPPGVVPFASDPHVRAGPTATGAVLGLGPGESPLDRVLGMAQRLDACATETRGLQARVVALEAAAATREQALAEGLREVEAATGEVSRARAEQQSLRKEIADLKGRLRQVEKEDLDTLRSVIAALERLLEPPPPAKRTGP